MVLFSASGVITGNKHHQCAQLSAEDFAMLSKVSDRVIFLCTQCFGKVPAALSPYFISEKHNP